MPTRLRPVALTIGVSLVAGCSLVTATRESSDAIGGSFRPLLLIAVAVIGLAPGGVAFLALRLAIVSAARAAAPR